MQVTLVYLDHDTMEGRGRYSIVKVSLYEASAKEWVEEQPDPFRRTNITWRIYPDGAQYYGAYQLRNIEVDDSLPKAQNCCELGACLSERDV